MADIHHTHHLFVPERSSGQAMAAVRRATALGRAGLTVCCVVVLYSALWVTERVRGGALPTVVDEND